MDPMLVVSYTLTTFLSWIVLSLLASYLNSMSIAEQTIRDRIQKDLVFLVEFLVTYVSCAIIVRELTGPLDEIYALGAMLGLQCIFDWKMICLVSLKISHCCFIFESPALLEMSEVTQQRIHRLFVGVSGIAMSFPICLIRSGFCGKVPIHIYLMQEANVDNVEGQGSNSTMRVVYSAIFLSCQLTIEVIRFIHNWKQDQAFQSAKQAMNQLEEASKRLYGQNLAQLNARSLFQSVRVAWAEEAAEVRTVRQRFNSTRPHFKKVIKAAVVYGIFPVVVFAILGNLIGRARSFRPHGATLLVLSLYGIIFPSLVICLNQKIRLFVAKIFREKVLRQ